jgi:hypothetical protein
MKTETSVLVATVVSFFKNPQVSNEAKKEAWSILTALRGPDTEDSGEKLKTATTNVIRYKVFGGPVVIPGTTIKANGDDYTQRSRRAQAKKGHFRFHAREAFKALGLSW